MNFYYVNSNNEKIDFSDYPYVFQEGDLLDYSWGYSSQENEYGNTLDLFKKNVAEKNIKIAIVPDFSMSKDERNNKIREYKNKLFEIFEVDIINNKDGKMYTNTGYYLPCRIYASEKTDWNLGIPFMFNNFKVISANPYWIKEQTKDFTKSSDYYSNTGNLDYPYDYMYDYTPNKKGFGYWFTGNSGYSDFEMTIYGPCINPRVLINNYPYEVFDTLENYEYIVIKNVNQEKTVIKYRNNGTTVNLFDSRAKEKSIFSSIPPGKLTLNWNGDFKFTLKLFEKRSEPKW